MSSQVITGKVRASHVHIFEPYSTNGSSSTYFISIIIPKSDTRTIEMIMTAIDEAKQEGVRKWKDRIPYNVRTPLHDGDLERPYDPAYKNSYYIDCFSGDRPGIIDRKRLPVSNPTQFYSGCYIRISVIFYPFKVGNRCSICACFRDVQFWSSGKPLDDSLDLL